MSDKTVFVVDDDEAMAASIAALLMADGLDVETYNSAEAFLEIFDGTQKGCLVLDMRLPGMSGSQLHERLVAEGFIFKIVMISGHVDWQASSVSLENGVIACLEKPFQPDTLCEAVQSALS